MTNKAFSVLLLFTLVFGGALGAAFAAGVALGKSQGPDPSQESASLRPPRSAQNGESRPGGFQSGESRPGAEAGGREGGFARRSGDPLAAPEGGSGPGRPGDGVLDGGRQGIIGTVDHVQDDMVTLNTFQGTVQVRLQEETTIQSTAEGTVADLVEGANIRIIGRRDEAGNVQARAVTLLLEGAEEGTAIGGRQGDSLSGRGGFERTPPLTGTIVSVENGVVIVDAPQGQMTVTLQAETTIQKTTEGTQSDLVEGVQVRVIGRTGEAGNIVARSLMVVSDDVDGFFGRRGDRGRQ
ncbi:MAG: hypothetical protein BZY80_07145 [SAR202 cluster bacterium Io17-Chloro-G2]|nr:MAG: hypothetical protein BZY80_07145 [SAR202 cluster bacterium Io17-Chloro-G2]